MKVVAVSVPVSVFVGMACGEVQDIGELPDAAVQADAAREPDAATDAAPDAGCQPTVLLRGGVDYAAQGWQLSASGTFDVTLEPDATRIKTAQSPTGAGSFALLSLPAAFDPAAPFAIEFVVLSESSAGHNQFDASLALLGSYGGGLGSPEDRAQMIYLDDTLIGWGDDSQRAQANNLDNAFHTYVLAVDAQQVTTVSRDGVPMLTRSNFITNGTVAIGDQTNEPGLEGAMRIRSVRKLCP